MCRRPCGCSSNARMGGKGRPPARATGPRCRGDAPVFAFPIDRRLRLCAHVGTQHLFVVVRRRSCVVSGAWTPVALLASVVLCERARCAQRSGRRARARCCPVACGCGCCCCGGVVCVATLTTPGARVVGSARAAAEWCARLVPGRGEVGFLSWLRAGRCAAARAACVRPSSCLLSVPAVLEMSLMPPQVVGAVVGAVSPLVRGACSRRCRRPAWCGGVRRGGGVGVALAVDAVVGRREDAAHLSKRGDCLVEVEAQCDEVVDRGLRHSSPGSNGDDSEAAREVPLPRGAGVGWRDPGEDGRVWTWGVGSLEVWVSQSSHLSRLSRTLRPRLASSGKVDSMAVTDRRCGRLGTHRAEGGRLGLVRSRRHLEIALGGCCSVRCR